MDQDAALDAEHYFSFCWHSPAPAAQAPWAPASSPGPEDTLRKGARRADTTRTTPGRRPVPSRSPAAARLEEARPQWEASAAAPAPQRTSSRPASVDLPRARHITVPK
ncbi:hypothetical protein VTO73DRAFT_6763 [Trametes versicolor]